MLRLPVLIDGNAFAHRWFHRWAYLTGVEGTPSNAIKDGGQATKPRRTSSTKKNAVALDAASLDAILIDPDAALHTAKQAAKSNRAASVRSVNPEKFALNNARSLIALASSFTLDDITAASTPTLPQAYDELGDTRNNQLIICFDLGDGGRSSIYEGYKKSRKEKIRHEALPIFFKEPAALYRGQPPGSVMVIGRERDGAARSELDWIHKLNVEADDMLAAISTRLADVGQPHVIMTHDMDVMHCVRDDVPVVVYDPNTKRLCNEAIVTDRVGVQPSYVQAYKVLAGDKADEIPGVDKIGKKRAIQLLEQFSGSLDDIVRRGPTEASSVAIRTALTGAGPRVELCKQLVLPRPCDSELLAHVSKFLGTAL